MTAVTDRHRAARAERRRDADKLHEALDAIQSLILHADCLAGEVQEPEARKAVMELQQYAQTLSEEVGGSIKAALYDLGEVGTPVRLVPITGTVNEGD